MNDETRIVIIDPPVSAFSDSADIREWIDVLEAMEDGPERTQALDDARRWLAIAEERESNAGG